MRALLWILLFATLCAAIALFQSRITYSARAERDAVRGARKEARAEPEGFGHAIVGEASGAPLVEPDPRVVPPPPSRNGAGGTAPRPDPSIPNQQNTHVVKRGESLSTICQMHYGTAKPDLVAALARFNKLKGVDAIREGQPLAIPPLATLNVQSK